MKTTFASLAVFATSAATLSISLPSLAAGATTPKAVPAPAAAAAAVPAAAASAPAGQLPAEPRNDRISHGRFDQFDVYLPGGTPKSFVLFLSGEGGWATRDKGGVVAMVNALVADGAMVAAIDTPKLLTVLEKDGGDCVFPDGDLENLSHFVQAYYHLPTYLPPILVGHSAGAALAYGVLAQAPAGAFAGALTTAFCPDLNLSKPLCPGNGARFSKRDDNNGVDFLPAKTLTAPWLTLHGEIDQVCDAPAIAKFAAATGNAGSTLLPKVGHAFSAPENWLPTYRNAYDKMVAAQAKASVPPPPSSLTGLPVIEVPATTAGNNPDVFAILVSGDGGWAGIDEELAAHLSADGMPVIGVDSLRYFWTARTPEGFAADLDRIMKHYRRALNRERVLLIGYSQGADVMPAALNKLPIGSRNGIALAALLGLAERAQFEFHLTNWVDATDGGLQTRPEIAKLLAPAGNPPLLCVYGEKDDESICPDLVAPGIKQVKMPGGHHFGGEYERLAQEILGAIPAAKRAAGKP